MKRETSAASNRLASAGAVNRRRKTQVKTMKPVFSLSILALAIAAPTVTLAQSYPADQTAPQQAASPPPQTAMPATAAPSAETNAINASTGQPLPPDQASALASGDNRLITNGPVPDTAANRAKYGGPNSRAGRHTKPAGN